ncbi:MAG: DNA repair protein RadA [candidate division KSB1 bacterium]|nr:DNA repair protein RadA [candidate division KSB1 bacterium]MDZ7333780.1 DNA repair protein RadA [candidate division KSB1 bacterium]MDZ7357547.1 DNA repair protein RadA [candidate division KSB1 bacterium]MDZ7376344.1 DNA repair protein RadA [candidate division KSB1 bacterium]MDZ7400540.1 DNA repair protein RadA [candidate division KSB1 bacterium]
MKTQYICQSCGFVSARWLGRCSECGAWNSMVEEAVEPKADIPAAAIKPAVPAMPLAKIQYQQEPRILCHSQEFNRVLGGGIVHGSLVLIGGDPGIGKSTLMLQEAARLANESFKVLYVSGEESLSQIKMRAERLGLTAQHLFVLTENDLGSILHEVDQLNPQLIVIDSIQTIYRTELESSPGSISQVRECAQQLLRLSKERSIPVFLVGHVTKDGFIAGPKVLEHTVDTLLFFEGDRDHFFRILRAVKNRFGSTNEIGVFAMTDRGLKEVPNPSEMFLAQRAGDSSGSSVICVMEGSRPILLEVQALVSPSNYGLPQRSATGIDPKRLAMLLAVLEKRVGVRIGTFDVFVNAVGGVRIDETAADLGIAMAIASSLKNTVIQPDVVLIGEIGLAGEIRPVPQIERRISEAEKLGFKQVILPSANAKSIKQPKERIKFHPVDRLAQAVAQLIA